MKQLLVAAGLLLALGARAQAVRKPAPDATTTELYQRVARLDAEMFAAFNAHDIPKLMRYFTPDL